MPLVVDVPLNTAIADLDEALRLLLTRELGRHGFEGVDVAFDAPSKDWAGKLTNPTVNLFLYDLREAVEQREGSGADVSNGNGGVVETRPPLRLELTYAVTGWTKAVEDEHRLLSQVLSILFSYRQLPRELLDDVPDAGSRLRELQTLVGQPREEKSDFWSAVGGPYKASIDYVVRLRIDSGAVFVRGPEVRMQTLRTGMLDGPARTMTEYHRFGGTVTTKGGEPVADAWVALPDAGRWSVTDREGRFRFDRVAPGEHQLIARTASGAEARLKASVPGDAVDLIIGAK
jgi:hypothetical protein